MNILPLKQENLVEFQNLYIRFYFELRSKQGWKPGDENAYKKEAAHYFNRGDIILLAVQDGKSIGFARVSSREGNYWLEEIYVVPTHRGKGIGSALVKEAEREVMKHDDSLYLFVLPQDKEAIGFWKRMGYDTINTIELVKNIDERNADYRHTVELLGENFKIYGWKNENFDEEELEFMHLLERFYENGGTKEDFLDMVNKGIKDWLENVKRCRLAIEKVSKNVGRDFHVTPSELWRYLNAESYEKDTYTPQKILENDYLILHELREIEELKKKGMKITSKVILENPEVIYEAHIKALQEELRIAFQKGDKHWIKSRIKDLRNYLEDPYLPEKLRPQVKELLKLYQN